MPAPPGAPPPSGGARPANGPTAGSAGSPFTRPDPEMAHKFDDDVGRGDLLPHFPGGRWAGDPIPVVVREHGRQRPIGDGTAVPALGPDGLQADQITWSRSIEDYFRGVPFARLDAEFGPDGRPVRFVATANDPTADPAWHDPEGDPDGDLDGDPDGADPEDSDEDSAAGDPAGEAAGDPGGADAAAAADPGGDADPDVDDEPRTPIRRNKMSDNIRILKTDTYEDLVHKFDGDHESLARRLFKTVGRLATKPAVGDDQVIVSKADMDLLTQYREAGTPDEVRASKGDVERLRKEAGESAALLGRYRELGEPDVVAAELAGGRDATGKLAKADRDASLRKVAETMKYNPDTFARRAARDGEEYVPVERIVKGAKVKSYDVKSKDAAGKEVVRPIEELESTDWSDLGPALRGAPAKQETPAPGGYPRGGRPAPPAPRDPAPQKDWATEAVQVNFAGSF